MNIAQAQGEAPPIECASGSDQSPSHYLNALGEICVDDIDAIVAIPNPPK